MNCLELAMEVVRYLLQLVLMSESTGFFLSLRNYWKEKCYGVPSSHSRSILIVLHVFSWKVIFFSFFFLLKLNEKLNQNQRTT